MKKIMIVILVMLGFLLGACFPPTPNPVLDTSAAFVEAAWNSFNKGEYAEAITYSQECIDRWEGEAIKQQSTITQAPPNGTVTNDEKKDIFSHWALNDVGTAYFIKAWSLEKLGKSAEAADTYKKVLLFPYARTWDNKGYFWSPAEQASKK